MKGQISTELLIIVALILLIFIPLLWLVYVKAGEASSQIAAYQAELTVNRIASLANSVSNLGTETAVTTEVYLPKNTKELAIRKIGGDAAEITLTIETGAGEDTPVVGLIKAKVSENQVLASDRSAGGWIKLKISSGEDSTVKIEVV